MDIDEAKQILGITYRISAQELKNIYRKKALENHPDINKSPNASEMFKNINAAYVFLSKNITKLSVKPPMHPPVYCWLDKDKTAFIPGHALETDDLHLYFFWKETEYRVVIPKGIKLPTKIRISDIGLIVELKDEKER